MRSVVTRSPLRQKGRGNSGPQVMKIAALSALITLTMIAGCGPLAGGRTVVRGAGPDEMLKLRAGPGLGFRVIVGLPDGTELIRRDCVTEASQLWCRVSLTDAPAVSGYVSADYIATP